MPESRDRLLRRRPDDATLFFPRPIHSTSLYIQPDEPEVSTFRWGSTTLNGSTIGVAASNPGRVNGVSRGSFGTPSPRRPGNGRRGGTGTVRRRPRRSLLLSWYPRKTLQDITPIVKENIHVEEVFEKLKCTEAGLTSDEVQKRLEVFGYNKLEEKKLWNLIVSTKGFCASFQRACLQRLVYIMKIQKSPVELFLRNFLHQFDLKYVRYGR